MEQIFFIFGLLLFLIFHFIRSQAILPEDCGSSDYKKLPYYFNGQCLAACEGGRGVEADSNQCTQTCSKGYIIATGENNNLFCRSCESIGSNNIYYEESTAAGTTQSCKASCPTGISFQTIMCFQELSMCPLGVTDNNHCKTCEELKGSGNYYYVNKVETTAKAEDKCVLSCPTGYLTAPNNFCRSCPDLHSGPNDKAKKYYNGQCVESCNYGYINGDTDYLKICQTCESFYGEKKRYFKDGDCINECPDWQLINTEGEAGKIKECKYCKDLDSSKPFFYDFKCYEDCSKIEGKYLVPAEDNKTCKTCLDVYSDKPFYHNGSCVLECPLGYIPDMNLLKCATCFQIYGEEKKYMYKGECVSDPSVGYIIDNETGLLGHCYSNCKECFGPTNQNCTKCNGDFYLIEDDNECVETCPGYLTIDKENHMCVSCGEREAGKDCEKYIYNGECYNHSIIGTYLDPNQQDVCYLKDCAAECYTCDGPQTINSMGCTSCYAGEDAKNNTKRFLTKKRDCVTICPKDSEAYSYSGVAPGSLTGDNETLGVCMPCSEYPDLDADGNQRKYYYSETMLCYGTCPGGTIKNDTDFTCTNSNVCAHQCLSRGQCTGGDCACDIKEHYVGRFCEIEFDDKICINRRDQDSEYLGIAPYVIFYYCGTNINEDTTYKWGINGVREGCTEEEFALNGINEKEIKVNTSCINEYTSYAIYNSTITLEVSGEANAGGVNTIIMGMTGLFKPYLYKEGLIVGEQIRLEAMLPDPNPEDVKYNFYYENIYGQKMPFKDGYCGRTESLIMVRTDVIYLEITDAFSRTYYWISDDRFLNGLEGLKKNSNNLVDYKFEDLVSINNFYSLFVQLKESEPDTLCEVDYNTIRDNINNVFSMKIKITNSMTQNINLIISQLAECAIKSKQRRGRRLSYSFDEYINLYSEFCQIYFDEDMLNSIISTSLNNTRKYYHSLNLILSTSIKIGKPALSIYTQVLNIIKNSVNYLKADILTGEQYEVICEHFSLMSVRPSIIAKSLIIPEETLKPNPGKECIIKMTPASKKGNCEGNFFYCIDENNFWFAQKELLLQAEEGYTATDFIFSLLILDHEDDNLMMEDNNSSNPSIAEEYKIYSSKTVRSFIFDAISKEKTDEILIDSLNYTIKFPYDRNDDSIRKNEACISFYNDNITYPITYFDPEEKFFICTGAGTGLIAGLNNKELAAASIKNQFKGKIIEKNLLNVFSMCIVCGFLAFFFGFSIYLHVKDYREDSAKLDNDVLTKKVDFYIAKKDSYSNLANTNIFTLSIFLFLYSYSFLQVINLHYYSKPRVIRFLIQLLELLLAIILTIFPFFFRHFQSADAKINDRILNNSELDYMSIEISGLDIFLTIIMSVVALAAMHAMEVGLYIFLGYLDIADKYFTELKFHLLFYYKTYYRIELFKNLKSFRESKLKLFCLAKFVTFWVHENDDKVTGRVIDSINKQRSTTKSKKDGKKGSKPAKIKKIKKITVDENGNEILRVDKRENIWLASTNENNPLLYENEEILRKNLGTVKSEYYSKEYEEYLKKQKEKKANQPIEKAPTKKEEEEDEEEKKEEEKKIEDKKEEEDKKEDEGENERLETTTTTKKKGSKKKQNVLSESFDGTFSFFPKDDNKFQKKTDDIIFKSKLYFFLTFFGLFFAFLLFLFIIVLLLSEIYYKFNVYFIRIWVIPFVIIFFIFRPIAYFGLTLLYVYLKMGKNEIEILNKIIPTFYNIVFSIKEIYLFYKRYETAMIDERKALEASVEKKYERPKTTPSEKEKKKINVSNKDEFTDYLIPKKDKEKDK
ncbi:MAG: hypothetical protein MJ252_01435 [archaeon]|nr:hypothetical protein [archaeon]